MFVAGKKMLPTDTCKICSHNIGLICKLYECKLLERPIRTFKMSKYLNTMETEYLYNDKRQIFVRLQPPKRLTQEKHIRRTVIEAFFLQQICNRWQL
jgi:hypothetical protein